MGDDNKNQEGDKPFHLSIAKRYILRENKVPKEDIDSIKSDKEADELIKHFQQKENSADENQPQKNIHNLGNQDFILPDPENPKYKINRSVQDFLKPARANNFMEGGIYKKGSRLMRVFTDEYPEGRVI